MSSTGGKITDWVSPGDKSGEFKRQVSSFRDFISSSPGSRFPPEAGRYHLFVSFACPWAHRTLITRALKGLEDIISVSVVHWHLGDKGWRFVTSDDVAALHRIQKRRNEHRKSEVDVGEIVQEEDEHGEGMDSPLVMPGPGEVPGTEGFTHLRDVYFAANKDYNGRFTVPVLWDKKEGTIVSNESSEIIRMLYTEFDSILPESYCHPTVDLLPENLYAAIEETNTWTYDLINNGVYKSGFATTRIAYLRNVRALFSALDRAEAHLASVQSEGPYYYGARLTEADIRLYVTIIRFDPVYVQHFKCNIRDIRSGYPHLHRWMRHLFWNVPAFRDTTNFDHIKFHYTRSHPQINPLGITPLGPVPDIMPLNEEHTVVKAKS